MNIPANGQVEATRQEPLSPWPFYDDDERAAADRVLRSGKVNYWTGNECKQFEKEFAEYHGVAYGIALANGTLALELALMVLNIGVGDEVIVTPRSYFASASCIVLAGATPVFVDVDETSQNVTAESIHSAITDRTKAIITVHLGGWPCEMRAIMKLARHHKLYVVEDCAQAHGARVDDQLVGSFGDLAAFSFCQDKIMTTAGEGGMLLTNNRSLWSAAWSFKEHGKSWERVHESDHAPGFRWLHESFGSNRRMTELQAAIGRVQLKKLDSWVETRRGNARLLNEGLRGLPAIRTTVPRLGVQHAYYKYYALVRPAELKSDWNRDRVLESLEAEGIPGWSGSCPELYREKAFTAHNQLTLPVANSLGETSIMLPVHPTLGKTDMHDMIRAVRKVVGTASR